MENILLVDDDELLLEVCAEILVRNRYRVTTALDGHDALAKYSATPFDLVVTDIVMPGEDGSA